ncbi:MAG: carboxypeptidase-like regulatory domain-containing protein [Dokdonella sp.]
MTPAHAEVTVHGTITRGDTGAPLPGVTVSIGKPLIFAGYSEIASRITAADGTYDWTGGCSTFNPPYSSCRVLASAPGFADSAVYFDPMTAQSFVLNLSMHTPAAISGHVRYAADGSAAAGRHVLLTCIQSDAPICEHGITAVVGANGGYVFNDLPGGSYRLCSGALVANTIAQCHDHVDHGALADDQGYTPLILADGETRTSVDFDLASGGSIRGTLHDGYANAVLPNRSILLEIYDANGVIFAGIGATTDDSGAYVVHGLPNGSFYLRAIVGSQFADNEQVYPNLACDVAGNCPLPTSGQPLVIGAAATLSGIDFTVHPFAVVTGHISAAANGSPLGGIPLHVTQCGLMGQNCGSYQADTASAAGTGNYALYLPKVQGRLYVGTENVSPYIDQVYPGIPCLPFVDCTTLAQVFSPVRGDVFSDVNFSLELGASISGHVNINGGDLISLPQLVVYDAAMHGLSYVYADANGQYTTPAWIPGTYFVGAHLGDACTFYNAQPCLNGDQNPATFQPTPIGLSAGEIRTGIDFVLYPADSVFRDGFGAN